MAYSPRLWLMASDKQFFSYCIRSLKIYISLKVTCQFWASDPKWPPPNHPFCPPTLIKRVSLCSECKQPSACTVLSLSHLLIFTWRVIRQKLICARSCSDHLFSAQIQQPKPLPKHFSTSIMQFVHNAMRELQVWNPWTHPTAYLGTFRAFLWPGGWVPIDWAWANNSKITLNILWKWPSKFLEKPPTFPDPPFDHLRIDSLIYQSISLDVRVPNM